MAREMESSRPHPNRRDFVRAGVGLSAAGLAALGAADQVLAQAADASGGKAEPFIKPGDTILFQGDSITDAGRKRGVPDANSEVAMGSGYAWYAACQILVDSPDANLKIYNRGVSGDQIFQLAHRWQKDCLDLKPNVLSILVGVNDFARTLDRGSKRTVEEYERDYRDVIKRTKDALPDVKLVICEPFVLKTGEINDKWFPAYDGYRAAARQIAEDAKARFVPFQTMFDVASKVAPPATWAKDGVHPTGSGAAIMSHWWMKTVGA